MKKVDIYTSNTCGYCHAAKDYFNENNIEFTEHNISENSQAKNELMQKGYRSVPVIIIDNNELLGFDKEKLSSLLGI